MEESPEISIHLNSLKGGIKPITLKTKSYNKTMDQIMTVVRKKAGKDANAPLFLYFKQFALYPDSTIQDLICHSPEATDFDIGYSFDVCFG